MSDVPIETIRACINANHGGLRHLSDEDMRSVWRSHTDETRKEYLERHAAESSNPASTEEAERSSAPLNTEH